MKEISFSFTITQKKPWHNKKFVSRISWASAMLLKNSMYLSPLANTEFKQEHPQWFLEHTSIFYSKNHKGKPSALQTIHVLVYFIWLTVNPAFQSWIISVWWHQIKGSDSCSHANKWGKQNVRDRNELCSIRTLPLFFWTFSEGKFESMEEQQHRTNIKYILWRACRNHTSVEHSDLLTAHCSPIKMKKVMGSPLQLSVRLSMAI